MSIKRPEILSPAGDFEKLRFAVKYGADAVYMAGNMFGMRAAAGNFDSDEMSKGVEFAHAHGVKVYITANVMPRNDELQHLPAFLEQIEQAKADAVIVADMGVMAMAKKYAPNVPIHVSTQTSIVNHASASAWHDLGAERIVLARELTLEDITEIRAKTPKELEIEAFVHGAMCISYSGRCLISNYMTGRDANRGACAQPCRWRYALVEEKRPNEYYPVYEDQYGTYLYNSKDMCMIEHIPELIKAGIDSFKIEGRAKTAYYTAGITNAYKQAVNAYMENPEGFVLPEEIRAEIHKVSHRNYFTGFYFDKYEHGQYYEDAHYIREWDVTAMPVSCDDDGNAVFNLKNKFFLGDELELIEPNRPPYRFKVNEMFDDKGESLEVARHPAMNIHLKFPFKVGEYAILRREKSANEKD